METTEKAIELERGLNMFSGTEHWYQHFVPKVLFTDGIKFLADEAKAYWFIDLIASWQTDKKVAKESFQVWIIRVDGHKAVVTCEDGNGNVVASQDIPYTDFPLKELKVYLEDDGEHKVILLTGEH
jgi:hypothetical protein